MSESKPAAPSLHPAGEPDRFSTDAPHEFKGRLDRWCELCNKPDRDPIHKALRAGEVAADKRMERLAEVGRR